MTSPDNKRAGKFGILLLLTALVLAAIFHLSFSPPQVMFSSDGPLGYIASQWQWAEDSFKGFWQDLNWVGSEQPSATPTVSMALFLLLGPVGFLKFYAPLTLLILGISAWFLFRRLGFSGPVCVLGGFAAALNTHPFSFACWGLGSLALTFAFSFFAMGLLASKDRNILHVILAGFCIGMGVAEGFDNGAIMSLYVSIWLLFLWYQAGSEKPKQVGKAAIFVGLMAISAALLSAQTLHTLITTQIQGVSGTQQDTQTKEQRWDWATQWSFPKAETLRVIVPGLYGYRMDTPDGGEYWGTVGRQPGWEQHRQGMPRHSGAGEYAGVLVCLLAVFSIACAWGKSKLLSDYERRVVWFWVIVGLVSLLLSFGRHAPFYQILYSLPYFSTIRNPIKFMLPFQMALLILFGFGLQCLYRKYEQSAVQSAKSAKAALSDWWKSAAVFERRYAQVILGLLAAFVLGYLIFYSSAREVRSYLTSNGFSEADAAQIHKFSLREVRWTILFLVCSVGVILLALAGWFTGARARWLTIGCGLILAVDLYRANQPWVAYYNYREKYELNSLLSTLKENAHDRRITAKFHPMAHYLSDMFAQAFQVPTQSDLLNQFYNEWIQHQFQYYRIHSLDISQMPRVPELDQAFMSAFMPRTTAQFALPRRMWELTSTRWILAEKNFAQYLNQAMDPQKKRFRVHSDFSFVPKSGVVNVTKFDELKAEIVPNGPFAIIEFAGALPRAKFYTNWQVMADDAAALAQLASESFDPQEMLIVNGAGPAPATNSVSAGTNSVKVLSYQPREWRIEVENSAPGILLLNDRFDDDWSVQVNGQRETMLRCNHLMRGVQLPAGKHTVVFSYSVPRRGLLISLVSIVAAILIAGYLGLSSRLPRPREKAEPARS